MKPMTEEQKQARRDALAILRAAAPEAAEKLLGLMRNAKDEVSIRAAETVIERVYGKAAQPIEGSLGAEIRVVIDGGEDLSG